MNTKKGYKLTASYNVNLPAYLLINRPEEDKIIFTIRKDEFDVILEIIREEDWVTQLAGEHIKTFGVAEVSISVTRVEDVRPPPVIKTLQEGQKDYVSVSEYYRERRGLYRSVAQDVLERLI
jgi:hypothetical protein